MIKNANNRAIDGYNINIIDFDNSKNILEDILIISPTWHIQNHLSGVQLLLGFFCS